MASRSTAHLRREETPVSCLPSSRYSRPASWQYSGRTVEGGRQVGTLPLQIRSTVQARLTLHQAPGLFATAARVPAILSRLLPPLPRLCSSWLQQPSEYATHPEKKPAPLPWRGHTARCGCLLSGGHADSNRGFGRAIAQPVPPVRRPDEDQSTRRETRRLAKDRSSSRQACHAGW